MPLVLGCLLAVILSSCQVGNRPTAFYNPLREVDGADPWLLFHDGNYYLTATQWSSIRMWKSPTLAGLATATPVTIWSDSTRERCCNVWAPEFHLLEGPDGPRWYVYYTAGTDGTLDNQRMHVLESSGADPLGPYTYKARMHDAQDGWAIDASPLKMPDGSLYILFSSWVGRDQSLFIAPMSTPWTISGGRVLLSTPTHTWEKSAANVNEGPEVLQHDGKTFIIYSASACWGPDYKLGMLEYNGGDVLSASSWVKHPEPVFERSDANGVYAPGHNGFFTSPDGSEHWIVYHANAQKTEGCTGVRTTRVQKFTWNADGTPNFGEPLPLDSAITPPAGERGAAPPPANTVAYALINRESSRCLVAAGRSGVGEADSAQEACGAKPEEQWSADYLGNGHYRLSNRKSGKALEVVGGSGATEDGAALQQASWSHSGNQQWRFIPAEDGWLRIVARHSGKMVDTGTCETDGGATLHQRSEAENNCQQFRLQPLGQVEIVNANSTKLIGVEQASTADGARAVLWSDAGTSEQRWSFVHQDNGFYQLMADHSDKCLAVEGSAGVRQAGCGSGTGERWRIEPLNDGTIRLVAREGGQVLDVKDCHMANGAIIQQWSWMNNPCQRFRLAAP